MILVLVPEKARPEMPRRAETGPENTSPAAKLRALIQEKAPGRPYHEISKDAGMASSKVSQIVTGQIKSPSVQTIDKILRAIGADFCDYERA